MAKLRGQVAHASSKKYMFRLKYVMRPLQKIASITPWANENSKREYFHKLDLLYKRWISGNNVLDIGCGPGHLSDKFINYYSSKSYIGLDYSALMAKDAKNVHHNEIFIAGDTLNLPFKDSSFNIVHSSRLFHHLLPQNRAQIILEQLRVASKAVIIEDLFGFEKGFLRKPHQLYYTIFDRSYYRYTLSEWDSLFRSLNLNVIEQINTDECIIEGRCACWIITH